MILHYLCKLWQILINKACQLNEPKGMVLLKQLGKQMDKQVFKECVVFKEHKALQELDLLGKEIRETVALQICLKSLIILNLEEVHHHLEGHQQLLRRVV